MYVSSCIPLWLLHPANEPLKELADVFFSDNCVEPFFWNTLEAIIYPGKTACDTSRGVRVITKVDCFEDSFLK